MASPPRERVNELFSLVRDWVRFKRYERSRRRAESEASNVSSSGMETTARNRTIGGIIIGFLILIFLMVMFSCTASFVPQGGEPRDPPLVGESSLPSDPDTLDPQPTGTPPPDMELESAYRDGYYTEPETGARYLIARIDRDAQAPSLWICQPAKDRHTQLCIVGRGSPSQDEAEPLEEPAPEAQADPGSSESSEDADASTDALTRDAGESGSSTSTQPEAGDSKSTPPEGSSSDDGQLVDWVQIGVGIVGSVLLPVLIWQWPKRAQIERFYIYREEVLGVGGQDHEPVDTVTTGAAEGDSASSSVPRRPSIGGGDLGPPV